MLMERKELNERFQKNSPIDSFPNYRCLTRISPAESFQRIFLWLDTSPIHMYLSQLDMPITRQFSDLPSPQSGNSLADHFFDEKIPRKNKLKLIHLTSWINNVPYQCLLEAQRIWQIKNFWFRPFSTTTTKKIRKFYKHQWIFDDY